MAKSQYEYVKGFELLDTLLPNTWLVVRLDGRGFSRFSTTHDFHKPNDVNALRLMNRCAAAVMEEYRDIILAYGESDEFSFVFKRNTSTYGRRGSKLVSCLTSLFSASYVFYWSTYFPHISMKYVPSFDGRVVVYPTVKNLRDYLSWRQADCHINNLYNTCFWSLVHDGMSKTDAGAMLMPTNSGDKNELLFSRFNRNYNDIDAMYRKGSVLVWEKREESQTKLRKDTGDMVEFTRKRKSISFLHCDIIGNSFWEERRCLLQE